MSSWSDPEKARLAAVHALQWLETAGTENFDRLCRLAAAYFRVPTVLISLVEKDRQWFAGRVGFDPSQTPIEQSFCRYTIAQRGVMQVPDARRDPRFVDNALVTAAEGICFYAGAPLRNRQGLVLGSLCLVDKSPRELEPEDVAALEDFAELVMVQIEQRQLLKYRDVVSGLPNVHQLLLDTRDLPLGSDSVRLVVVIQVQDLPATRPLEDADSLALQHWRRDVAERLRVRLEGIAELYHVGERDFCLQVSCIARRHQELFRALLVLVTEPFGEQVLRVGLAVCETGTQTVVSLMRKATQSLTIAANRQRPWAVYDEAQDGAQRRALDLLNDFTPALANGDVYLDYQPRFSLVDGRVLSAEALIRWCHPRLGRLSPAEFIPLLEGAGKISAVTRWVVDRALADLSGWADRDIRLSLNLSPQDFHGLEIARVLADACRRHRIAPSRLEVEITEGEWIRADKRVIAQLTQIRELGVDVAIDDFGTGYSNFAYLHEIPANILKLDKSLVTDLETSPRNRVIARSVLQLAGELGYRTVAEGIETFRCLSLLREYGCQEAQGFFLSRPLGVEHFTRQCEDIPLTFKLVG